MTGKAWEEHTACEGKAFEEMEHQSEIDYCHGLQTRASKHI